MSTISTITPLTDSPASGPSPSAHWKPPLICCFTSRRPWIPTVVSMSRFAFSLIAKTCRASRVVQPTFSLSISSILLLLTISLISPVRIS